MGRDRTPVKQGFVVPYDEHWAGVFRLEANRLAQVFAPCSVVIHHIGSTSIEGLCAKPVIDILVEAPDLPTIDQVTQGLARRGFEAKGEYGIPGRRYFSRPATSSELKIHVHAFRSHSPRVARHLLFRDYLRAHPLVAAEYCALKMRLAAGHAADPDSYQVGKERFIRRVLQDAETWR